MRVLIDGEEIEVLNDVKILWDQEREEGGVNNLQLTATFEGLIADEFNERGEVMRTNSIEHIEIMDVLSA